MKNEDKAITGGMNNEWFNVFREARKPLKKSKLAFEENDVQRDLDKSIERRF